MKMPKPGTLSHDVVIAIYKYGPMTAHKFKNNYCEEFDVDCSHHMSEMCRRGLLSVARETTDKFGRTYGLPPEMRQLIMEYQGDTKNIAAPRVGNAFGREYVPPKSLNDERIRKISFVSISSRIPGNEF